MPKTLEKLKKARKGLKKKVVKAAAVAVSKDAKTTYKKAKN